MKERFAHNMAYPDGPCDYPSFALACQRRWSRSARGFLGTWRRFVDSTGDKAEPSSASSVLAPPPLACLHDFAHVPGWPNLENVAVFHGRMLSHELYSMINV